MNPSQKLMKALSDEMRGMLCQLEKLGHMNCSVEEAMSVLGAGKKVVTKVKKGASSESLRKKILEVNEECILKDGVSVKELREILKKEKAAVAEAKQAAKKLEAEAKKAAKKLEAEAKKAAKKLEAEAKKAAKKQEAEAKKAAKKQEAEAKKAANKAAKEAEKTEKIKSELLELDGDFDIETVTLDGAIVVDDLKKALKEAKKTAKKAAKKAVKDAKKAELIKSITTSNSTPQLDEEIISEGEDEEEMIEWEHSSRPNEKLYLTGDFHVLDATEEHIGDYDAENDVIILVEE
jgi:hypothetical protein